MVSNEADKAVEFIDPADLEEDGSTKKNLKRSEDDEEIDPAEKDDVVSETLFSPKDLS
jgi:hypothetical protein